MISSLRFGKGFVRSRQSHLKDSVAAKSSMHLVTSSSGCSVMIWCSAVRYSTNGIACVAFSAAKNFFWMLLMFSGFSLSGNSTSVQ